MDTEDVFSSALGYFFLSRCSGTCVQFVPSSLLSAPGQVSKSKAFEGSHTVF